MDESIDSLRSRRLLFDVINIRTSTLCARSLIGFNSPLSWFYYCLFEHILKKAAAFFVFFFAKIKTDPALCRPFSRLYNVTVLQGLILSTSAHGWVTNVCNQFFTVRNDFLVAFCCRIVYFLCIGTFLSFRQALPIAFVVYIIRISDVPKVS